ncbi:MAG: ABC transporter ATP-binding protein [Chloroflexota bacterium]
MAGIEVRDVSLGYGRRLVLENLNFQVTGGEMVGLIGPNGGGKSTVIRALSRVIPTRLGKILVDGRDVTRIPRHDLARLIGVVPQIPLLPSAFTAFEIVLMGRNPHLGILQRESPADFESTWRAMELTSTRHLARRRVGELSGGEIQCLLIARVLVQATRVVLLDEPTANLDISRQVEILGLIKRLCLREKLAVLAALHDLNLASQYCDRLILLSQGKIYAEGTPREVINPDNLRAVYGVRDGISVRLLNGRPVVLPGAGNIEPAG